MTAKLIHFYFDYISPFAYFAWRKLPVLAKKYNYQIINHPVVFGKLLDKWGQLGPAEISPKRYWLNQYCLRYAHINGFNYNPPKKHPFNPLAALRISLKEVSGINQNKVIETIFEAGWTQGQDIGDLETLIFLLKQRSIEIKNIKTQISNPLIKKLLIYETNNAIKLGVFGVPTIIINKNLFWGNDQMEHIELLLKGKDPLDLKKLNIHINRPRSIDRKLFSKKNLHQK